MSNAAKRDAIAALLSTVEGVTGFARRPSAIRAGNAWPQWRGAERADGLEYVQAWQIVLVLDQATTEDADAAADRWGDAIADAVEPQLFVSAIAPANLPAQGPEGLYALLFTGRSE